MSEEIQLTPEEQSALSRVQGTKPDAVSGYYDDQGNEVGEPEASPDIPEKFKGKSLEDVVKAYTELEKKLSEKPKEEPKDTTTVEDKVNATLTPKDFTKYEEAYLSQGKLEDSHYKELEAKGLSREIIDAYVEGAKAKAQLFSKAVYDSIGGEQEYSDLIQWASTNIPQSMISKFNEDLASGDVERAKFAIETLQLRRGSPARRIDGSSAPEGGIKPYSDKGKWQQDVRNALYGKDKKFTAMVDAKYIASKKRGTL